MPLPRPVGRATLVDITEYDLQRPTIEPHDVIVDPDSIAWYSNFGEQTLGKLDPRTGAVTEFPMPELKPGFPTGALRSEEHTSELQAHSELVCSLLLEKKNNHTQTTQTAHIS